MAKIKKYKTGAKRFSIGKVDMVESISWIALHRLGKYMTPLQDLYGAGNFKKGIPIEDYEKSLVRHVTKYLAKKYEGVDMEPGVDHAAAIMFNIMGILHEEEKAKNGKTKRRLGRISKN